MFHFYKTCLIFLLFFSGRIVISLTGFVFTILSSYKLVTASAILFPKILPALWTTFSEAASKESSPVSNNCFLYFLSNDKNPYPLTYFLDLGSIEYHVISIY